MYGYVGLLAIGVITGAGLLLTLRSPKSRPRAFSYPERETDMRIVVQTSDEPALREVLGEFGVSYGAQDFASRGVALRAADGRIVVSFPHGLRPDMFLYLVNFLHYPFNGEGFAGSYGVGTAATALEGLGFPEVAGQGGRVRSRRRRRARRGVAAHRVRRDVALLVPGDPHAGARAAARPARTATTGCPSARRVQVSSKGDLRP